MSLNVLALSWLYYVISVCILHYTKQKISTGITLRQKRQKIEMNTETLESTLKNILSS